MRVAGVPRRYLLAEPEVAPTGLLLSLHGSRSSADGQARLSGLARLAETEGAVVAFPEAVHPIGTG